MKSWNEIHKAATVFSKRKKDACNEKSQTQMKVWKHTLRILLAGVLIGIAFFTIKVVHDRSYCIKLANMCVEQDPATAAWVFDMAKGRVLSFGFSGVSEDGEDNSVTKDWIDISVRAADGSVCTNQYLVRFQKVDENGLIISNFTSSALPTVELLWRKVRK